MMPIEMYILSRDELPLRPIEIYSQSESNKIAPFKMKAIKNAIVYATLGCIAIRIIIFFLGGSPGLVVMGGYSRSEGCGFESRHRILDGHFFTYICC